MTFISKLGAADAVRGLDIRSAESVSLKVSDPVAATPTAVGAAIAIASGVVTAAGVGAAIGDAVD